MSKEREAFESAMQELSGGQTKNDVNPVTGEYQYGVMQVMWKVWQAAKAQAVPEGFAIVPIESLDEAMSWANCASNESWSDDHQEEIDKHYRVIEIAMIQAQQPSSTSDCPDEP